MASNCWKDKHYQEQIHFFPFLRKLIIGSIVAEKWEMIVLDEPGNPSNIRTSWIVQAFLLQDFQYSGQGENVYIPRVAHSQGFIVGPNLLKYMKPHPGNRHRHFIWSVISYLSGR